MAFMTADEIRACGPKTPGDPAPPPTVGHGRRTRKGRLKAREAG